MRVGYFCWCGRPGYSRGECLGHHRISTGKQSRTGRAEVLRDDIDPIVVDRLVNGRDVECNAWERRLAAQRLRRSGWKLSEIAERLGIHERQVTRDLKWDLL